jgi:hypothetical protein
MEKSYDYRCVPVLLPGFGGRTAFRAADDMDMVLSVGSIKKAGDKIIFFGQLFFADRAMARYRGFDIRVAMWAAENMAKSVFLSGE